MENTRIFRCDAHVVVEEDEEGYHIELFEDGYTSDIFHTTDKNVKEEIRRQFQKTADELNKGRERIKE